MGSSEGGKWVLIIFIYYIFFFIIATAATMIYGGEIDQTPLLASQHCDSPRQLYEPFNPYPVKEVNFQPSLNGLANTECEKTKGVISQSLCDNIIGCDWTEEPTSIFSIFTGKTNYTCTGNIDLSYYEIDARNNLAVAIHENTKDTMYLYGSICDAPAVIDNQELCELFSCSWSVNPSLGQDIINTIEVTDSSTSFLKSMYSTGKQMVSFRYNFFGGEPSQFENIIISLLFVYLPMIILGFGIYAMVRG